MKSIDEHIQKDQSEIASAKEEGNLPKVRHLTEELKDLEGYKDHHPEDKHDPNANQIIPVLPSLKEIMQSLPK